MHPQGFAMPFVGSGLVELFASKDFSGGSNSVEFIGLSAVFGRFLMGTVELYDPLTPCEPALRSGLVRNWRCPPLPRPARRLRCGPQPS